MTAGNKQLGKEGTIGASVTVTHVPSGRRTAGAFTVSIEDAPVTVVVADIQPSRAEEFSGTVATFTDPYTADPSSDFTAEIDWGDGTQSAGTISGATGSFTVSGVHTFSIVGDLTVGVTVADAGGVAGAAQAPVHVKDPIRPSVGAIITGNTNDSNHNAIRDRDEAQQTGQLITDPELAPLTLGVPATANPEATVTLTITQTGNTGTVRVWGDSAKRLFLQGADGENKWTWVNEGAPEVVYVEGLDGSKNVNDVAFTVSVTDGGPNPTIFQPVTVSTTVSVYMTTPSPKLDANWYVTDVTFTRLVGTLNNPTFHVEAPPAWANGSQVLWTMIADPNNPIDEAGAFKDFVAEDAAGYVVDLGAGDHLKTLVSNGGNQFTSENRFYFSLPNRSPNVRAEVLLGNVEFAASYTINTVFPTITDLGVQFGESEVTANPDAAQDATQALAGFDGNGPTGFTASQGNKSIHEGIIWKTKVETPARFAPGGEDSNGPSDTGRFFYGQILHSQERLLVSEGYYSADVTGSDGGFPAGQGDDFNGETNYPKYDLEGKVHDQLGGDRSIKVWSMGTTGTFQDRPSEGLTLPQLGLRETIVPGAFYTIPYINPQRAPEGSVKSGPGRANTLNQNIVFPSNTTTVY